MQKQEKSVFDADVIYLLDIVLIGVNGLEIENQTENIEVYAILKCEDKQYRSPEHNCLSNQDWQAAIKWHFYLKPKSISINLYRIEEEKDQHIGCGTIDSRKYFRSDHKGTYVFLQSYMHSSYRYHHHTDFKDQMKQYLSTKRNQ